MNRKTTVGDKLRALRLKADLSQKNVGDQLGCASQFIYGIESGRVSLPPKYIKGFAKAYRIKPAKIVNLLVKTYQEHVLESMK